MANLKSILITGTSRGIGKYLAEYYLAKGYKIFGCSRSKNKINDKNYTHFSLDISNELNVKAMFSDILNESDGELYGLINNAGIASMNHSILTEIKTVRKIFEINLVATFLFCRESAKLMKRNGQGRIINFSTVASPLNLEGEAAYASSKSAVTSLTKILAKEFSTFGITVNALGPNPISTDLIKSVPKNKINSLLKLQSIKRMGHLEDISNVTDFFIKKSSSFITGQVLFLGGVS